jgi:hypothetical protein
MNMVLEVVLEEVERVLVRKWMDTAIILIIPTMQAGRLMV